MTGVTGIPEGVCQRRCRTRQPPGCDWPQNTYPAESVLLTVHETVVFRMGADPDPRDNARTQPCQCAVVVADANRDPIFTTLQSAEVKRWMILVFPPEAIILYREILNVRRQTVE